jgi:hypothetical protein
MHIMATKKRKDILFEFQHKRKAELEAWLVMEARLDEVIEALETLPERLTWSPKTRTSPPLPTGHSIRVRSLYCFAAVTYIRCFATGRRSRLGISQVPNVTAKDLVLHESIRLMRNQHLAHAVADEEGAHIYLHAKPHERAPSRFNVFNVILASENKATIRRFAVLAKKVRAFVRTRIAAAGDEIAQSFFGSQS